MHGHGGFISGGGMPGPSSGQGDQLNLARLMQLQSQGVDINMLMQLEMLKALSGRGNQRPQGEASPFGDGAEPELGPASSNMGRALRGMEAQKRLIRTQPHEVVRQFREQVLDDMGVYEGQPWCYRDHSRCVPWKHLKGLQTCYFLDMEVLQLLERGLVPQAAALLTQSAKTKHQAALDGGSWHLAWAFTGLADPLRRRPYAGTSAELQVMADFVEMEDKLLAKSKALQQQGSSETPHEDADNDGLKKKNYADKKAAAAAKAKAKAAAAP